MLRAALLVAALAGLIASLGACQRSPSAQMPGDPDDHRPWSAIPADAVLVASGTEPFWSARVRDGHLTYATPERPQGVTLPVSRFAGRGGVSFSGEIEGRDLTLAVGPGPCSDGMSDRPWPYGATLRLGERVLSGCARNGTGAETGAARAPESAPSRTPLP
ncbi:COG3650 family protein [Novosphingobium sp. 9]|uniref:COG3650 family protein n=1 Tax=Novosphingobium sp. 9 TaxID=2025349 RepID=UPI0021B63373|nr:hypothetical protein [Novosphingobium sp. 9]